MTISADMIVDERVLRSGIDGAEVVAKTHWLDVSVLSLAIHTRMTTSDDITRCRSPTSSEPAGPGASRDPRFAFLA